MARLMHFLSNRTYDNHTKQPTRRLQEWFLWTMEFGLWFQSCWLLSFYKNKTHIRVIDFWYDAYLRYNKCGITSRRRCRCLRPYPVRLDGCLFPRGYRLLSSVGILGMCTFWKPDYLVGGFSWYPWIHQNFGATLPRAEIYHAGYMDYGYPNFCR